MTSAPAPVVSVVIEGYNEYLSFGDIDTWSGLETQRYPLDRVEIILVGTAVQAERWSERFAGQTTFLRVKAVAVDDPWYFEMKNRGVREATGDVIVLADADVVPDPGWLEAIVEAIEEGADVVAGISLFRTPTRNSGDPFMQLAASISWAPLLGTSPSPRSNDAYFQAHNVAFRAAVARAHPFRTDIRHRVAGVFLPAELKAAGARLRFQPAQKVSHSFDARWWLRLHARFGYEIHRLRREHEDWPHGWVRRTWILEPPLTAGWHALLDWPRWFVFGRLMGASLARRVALFPLLLFMSGVARGTEMVGMYATMVAPDRMKRFAASV
ncbi:MAG TPA: glycosyltransferase [Gemmatimonadota bacterium]|nr:glycosyltransferase [Gemmatimonadota bacterium]